MNKLKILNISLVAILGLQAPITALASDDDEISYEEIVTELCVIQAEKTSNYLLQSIDNTPKQDAISKMEQDPQIRDLSVAQGTDIATSLVRMVFDPNMHEILIEGAYSFDLGNNNISEEEKLSIGNQYLEEMFDECTETLYEAYLFMSALGHQ